MNDTTQRTELRCADCGGVAHAGQSFCDDCGSFLNWEHQAGARPAAAEPAAQAKPEQPAQAGEPEQEAAPEEGAEPEQAAKPEQAAVPEPAQARPAAPATSAAPAAAAPPAPPAPPAAPPTLSVKKAADATSPVVPAQAPPTAAALGPEDDTTEVLNEPIHPASPAPPAAPVPPEVARARALLVPVADRSVPGRPAPEVAPVLPGTPSAARPTVRQPGDDDHVPHGELCPWCGTANQRDRHFCRRCAMRLAESPGGPQRRPWWRRIFDFRGREAPWAGERPRLRRDLGRIVRWTLAIAVAVALVVTVSTEATPATHAVEDHFATRAQIHQITFSAYHADPAHPASLAGDGYNNTWWGTGYGGFNTGQWLQANFATPTHLLNVIITPCAGAESDQVSVEACPQQLEALITNSSGKTSTKQLSLNDGQPQTFGLDARDVTSVRFIIESIYGVSPQKQVAVAEMEFFGPSNS
ncbi:zinc ribbon domain-containing protein [Streptacidiphilus sp. PB12-B1b]|uniref:NADase-type glycan-binding domain-containing protein n=1 Tax=Streptacidiphilus sp. PB12-B1b TaxID=2705012 RepID=UPI0015F9588B|nr:zinc ribbon domain-containing protein [Streptacidiphilus sp. PB12-B1b]QMU77673.1 zinc ribbon domain-containing protein [Streptacidiphilus sp. PB12-B1b]